jgi:prevent-host-death family protein
METSPVRALSVVQPLAASIVQCRCLACKDYVHKVHYVDKVQKDLTLVMTYTSKQAREQFSEVVNRVAFAGERVIVSRQGKKLVAVVPIEDLELLEQIQDRIDLEDARQALNEAEKKGTVSWRKLKAELGI